MITKYFSKSASLNDPKAGFFSSFVEESIGKETLEAYSTLFRNVQLTNNFALGVYSNLNGVDLIAEYYNKNTNTWVPLYVDMKRLSTGHYRNGITVNEKVFNNDSILIGTIVTQNNKDYLLINRPSTFSNILLKESKQGSSKYGLIYEEQLLNGIKTYGLKILIPDNISIKYHKLLDAWNKIAAIPSIGKGSSEQDYKLAANQFLKEFSTIYTAVTGEIPKLEFV